MGEDGDSDDHRRAVGWFVAPRKARKGKRKRERGREVRKVRKEGSNVYTKGIVDSTGLSIGFYQGLEGGPYVRDRLPRAQPSRDVLVHGLRFMDT